MKSLLIALTIILLSGCSLANLQTDLDKDGVSNNMDLCKSTPTLAKVDKYGCALDSDKDGVIDAYDKCKNTSLLDKVNKYGCKLK